MHFLTQTEALLALGAKDQVATAPTNTMGCSVYVYAAPLTAVESVQVMFGPVCVGVLTPVHTATAGPVAAVRITEYVIVLPLEIVTADQVNEMEFG